MADQRLRVLVVTDNPGVRSDLEFGIPTDLEVDFARDSRDAWSSMSTMTPAAVIVDLQTGSAGGYGLSSDMAADERLMRVPVVILLDREQDGWLAKQAGAAFFLIKPIEAVKLFKDLRDLITV